MLGSQVRVTTRRFERSERDDADQWLLTFEDGLQGRPMLTRAAGKDRLPHNGTRVSVKLDAERLASMFARLSSYELWPNVFAVLEAYRQTTEGILGRGHEILPALVGLLCPASEVALHARFADGPRVAVVAPNDWMHLEQEALTRRLHCENSHLVPLRDESGALLGRVGVEVDRGRHIRQINCAALVLHGVRCGGMAGLVGLALARENNRDVRRTNASVGGSPSAWSKWAAQVLDALPNQAIDVLLQLHPLLRDRDLRVWRYGGYAMTLDELVARIVASSELRVHMGEVSHEGYDDVGSGRFGSAFKLSDQLVITPQYRPSNWDADFPCFLGVVPIDYKSLLEEEFTRHWGGFEEYEENDAVVGEVDGIEI